MTFDRIRIPFRALATLSVALAALVLPGRLAAQDSVVARLRATYNTQYSPGFVVLPFSGAIASPQVREIVRRDLENSDRFQLRDPAGARAGDPVNAALWRERGADWVLEGGVEARPGGLTLRLTLTDAVYGQQKGTGAFTLPSPTARGFRMAVHAASDAVVRWATGEPGMAASRIAFVMAGRGSKEIYTVDSDGEGLTRVTSDGSIALSPSWAPDGQRLAYTSYRAGAPYLYERDLSTGSDRTVSDRTGLNITPSYAPDGRTIAFATTVGGGTEIATVGPAGLRQHTQGRRYASLSPSYAPDGGRIAFVSDRLGEPQIYVMSAGGEPRLVSDYTYGRRGYSTSPDWSPDGRSIAYHSRLNGDHQIVVVSPDGGRVRLLTDRFRNEDPSWAPDSRHIVFASTNRDGGGLFVLDTVTGKIRQLAQGRGYGLPDWSPVLLRAGN